MSNRTPFVTVFVFFMTAAGLWAQQDPERLIARFDEDGDKMLARDEFGRAMENLPRFRNAPELIDATFRRMDDDGDQKISIDEFKNAAKKLARRSEKNGEPASRPTPPPTQTPGERATADPEGMAFFEMKIRPILATQCFQCHSAKAEKLRGGLALDTAEGTYRGGSTGPAIVPGDPESSLLLQALRYKGDLQMPPKTPLPDYVVKDFEDWIKRGAPDPRAVLEPMPTRTIDIAKGKNFWSFQAPKITPPPTPENSDWAETEIDRYVLAALEREGLAPVGDADPYTFIRRIYFDLIGLPPTVAEIDAFVKLCDKTSGKWRIPTDAIAKVADQLLASPRFGETWGRHWLDVARFAETSGKTTNFNFPNAWRYRDWVIDAINNDMAYDAFIREQLAGDLMPAENDAEHAQKVIATGFLAIGTKSLGERVREQFVADLVDEQIDATTTAFLGLTVACARCHDHKYDPIPQSDYYAMAGIFRSTETCYGTIRGPQGQHPSPLIEFGASAKLPSAMDAMLEIDRREIEKQIDELNERFREARQNDGAGAIQFKTRANVLEAKLDAYTSDGMPKALVMGVREARRPTNARLLVRGEVAKPADIVPRGLVQVITDGETTIKSGSGRKELASWIASPTNPLTARVAVNRVWMHLFGHGIVPTCDNFGNAGLPPSHPELLDALALGFVRGQWSTKALIKKIVMSHTYRLASTFDAKQDEKDPDNVYLWRMSKKRLEAEQIRDAMLALSGTLDLSRPVGSPIANAGEGPTRGIERNLERRGNVEERFLHRAVYLPVIRNAPIESLGLFDFPDPSVVSSDRPTTSVPAQSLFLLNSPLVMDYAAATASVLGAEKGSDREKIARAFLTIFARPATMREIEAAESFMTNFAKAEKKDGARQKRVLRVESWKAFIQSLFATAEFLYLD